MELARDVVFCGGYAAVIGAPGMRDDVEAHLKLLIRVGDPPEWRHRRSAYSRAAAGRCS